MDKENKQIFKFKKFDVDQTNCAMKINTDGVLIAAMVKHNEPKYVLDIGTGTGVIAMMLAQRFPNAQVHAVEIDKDASETANKNFRNSSFNSRLFCHHTTIETFQSPQKFDLIVSNPPFFINDLKNEEQRKGLARHASVDFFEMLVQKSAHLLNKNGKVCFILPVKQAKLVEEIARKYHLKVSEQVNLHSDSTKKTFRVIISLTFGIEELNIKAFYIYKSYKEHTDEYKELLKDFFLAF
ncbi:MULTISPECIES: tRNA1(Val) (adenine(37)-N6)-methyltransferase [unclassified Pedobacter]|uniref:tRNA1(Val) (adenine(37)-N6)-methyltransferase n=1 Tax=unclassified Pedobacter TaxID=2628915 RepID=UPI0021038923|nr:MULTISPECIES: methyltransferase [unclassified Pedobacter]